MKNLLVRFLREEDGDVVQTVIIIAVFAALALLFGNTIKTFVDKLITRINETGTKADELVGTISSSQGG